MAETIGAVGFATYLDLTGFNRDIGIANRKIKSKKFHISPTVDLSGLHDFNKLIDVKIDHYGQLKNYVDRNPISPKFDGGGLKELEKVKPFLKGGNTKISVDVSFKRFNTGLGNVASILSDSRSILDTISKNTRKQGVIGGTLDKVISGTILGATRDFGSSITKGISRSLKIGPNKVGETLGRRAGVKVGRAGKLADSASRNLLNLPNGLADIKKLTIDNPSKILDNLLDPSFYNDLEELYVEAARQGFEIGDLVGGSKKDLSKDPRIQAELDKFDKRFGGILEEYVTRSLGAALKIGAQPLRIKKRVNLESGVLAAIKKADEIGKTDKTPIERKRHSETDSNIFAIGGVQPKESLPGRPQLESTYLLANGLSSYFPGSNVIPAPPTRANSVEELQNSPTVQFKAWIAENQKGIFEFLDKFMDTAEIKKGLGSIQDLHPFDRIAQTNLEGKDEDAIEIAGKIIAAIRQDENRKNDIIAVSGGTAVAENVISLLNHAAKIDPSLAKGVSNVRAQGFGFGLSGLTATAHDEAGDAKFQSFIGDLDHVGVAMFGEGFINANATKKQRDVIETNTPVALPDGVIRPDPRYTKIIEAFGEEHNVGRMLLETFSDKEKLVNSQSRNELGKFLEQRSGTDNFSRRLPAVDSARKNLKDLSASDKKLEKLSSQAANFSQLGKIEKAEAIYKQIDKLLLTKQKQYNEVLKNLEDIGIDTTLLDSVDVRSIGSDFTKKIDKDLKNLRKELLEYDGLGFAEKRSSSVGSLMGTLKFQAEGLAKISRGEVPTDIHSVFDRDLIDPDALSNIANSSPEDISLEAGDTESLLKLWKIKREFIFRHFKEDFEQDWVKMVETYDKLAKAGFEEYDLFQYTTDETESNNSPTFTNFSSRDQPGINPNEIEPRFAHFLYAESGITKDDNLKTVQSKFNNVDFGDDEIGQLKKKAIQEFIDLKKKENQYYINYAKRVTNLKDLIAKNPNDTNALKSLVKELLESPFSHFRKHLGIVTDASNGIVKLPKNLDIQQYFLDYLQGVEIAAPQSNLSPKAASTVSREISVPDAENFSFQALLVNLVAQVKGLDSAVELAKTTFLEFGDANINTQQVKSQIERTIDPNEDFWDTSNTPLVNTSHSNVVPKAVRQNNANALVDEVEKSFKGLATLNKAVEKGKSKPVNEAEKKSVKFSIQLLDRVDNLSDTLGFRLDKIADLLATDVQVEQNENSNLFETETSVNGFDPNLDLLSNPTGSLVEEEYRSVQGEIVQDYSGIGEKILGITKTVATGVLNEFVNVAQFAYGAAEATEDLALAIIPFGKHVKAVSRVLLPYAALGGASFFLPEVGGALGAVTEPLLNVSQPLLNLAGGAAEAHVAGALGGGFIGNALGGAAGHGVEALARLAIQGAEIITIAGTGKVVLEGAKDNIIAALPGTTQNKLALPGARDAAKGLLNPVFDKVKSNAESLKIFEVKIEPLENIQDLKALVADFNKGQLLFNKSVIELKRLAPQNKNQLIGSIGGTSKGVSSQVNRFRKAAIRKAKELGGNASDVEVLSPRESKALAQRDLKRVVIEPIEAVDSSVNNNVEKNWSKTTKFVEKELIELESKADKIGYEIQKDISEGSPGVTQKIRQHWSKTTKFISTLFPSLGSAADQLGKRLDKSFDLEINATIFENRVKRFIKGAGENGYNPDDYSEQEILEAFNIFGNSPVNNPINRAKLNSVKPSSIDDTIIQSLDTEIQTTIQDLNTKLQSLDTEIQTTIQSLDTEIQTTIQSPDTVIQGDDYQDNNKKEEKRVTGLTKLYENLLTYKTKANKFLFGDGVERNAGVNSIASFAGNLGGDEDPLGGLNEIYEGVGNVIDDLPDLGDITKGVGDFINELAAGSPVFSNILDFGKNLFGLAIAGFGLNFAVDHLRNFLGQSIEAGKELERFKVVLESVGRDGAGTYDRLFNEAQKYGSSFRENREGYKRLLLATSGTESEELVDPITAGFQKAFTAKQATGEQQARGYTAIEQILSKGGVDGSVQSEELRGQLSEALSGSINVAARVRGQTGRELAEDLKNANVEAADLLIKMAAFYEVDSEILLSISSDTFNAELTRLENNIELFRAKSGESLLPAGKLGLKAANVGLKLLSDNMALISTVSAIALTSVLVRVGGAFYDVAKATKAATFAKKLFAIESIRARKAQVGAIGLGKDVAGSIFSKGNLATVGLAGIAHSIADDNKTDSNIKANFRIAQELAKTSTDSEGNTVDNFAGSKSGFFQKAIEKIPFINNQTLNGGELIKLDETAAIFNEKLGESSANIDSNLFKSDVANLRGIEAQIESKEVDKVLALNSGDVAGSSVIEKELGVLRERQKEAAKNVQRDLVTVSKIENSSQANLDFLESKKEYIPEFLYSKFKEQFENARQEASKQKAEIEAKLKIDDNSTVQIINQLQREFSTNQFKIELDFNQNSVSLIDQKLDGLLSDRQLSFQQSRLDFGAAEDQFENTQARATDFRSQIAGRSNLQDVFKLFGVSNLNDLSKISPEEITSLNEATPGAEITQSINLVQRWVELIRQGSTEQRDAAQKRLDFIRQERELIRDELVRKDQRIVTAGSQEIFGVNRDTELAQVSDNLAILNGTSPIAARSVNGLEREIAKLLETIDVRRGTIDQLSNSLRTNFSEESIESVQNLLGTNDLTNFAQNTSAEIINAKIANLSENQKAIIENSAEVQAIIENIGSVATESTAARAENLQLSEASLNLNDQKLQLQNQVAGLVEQFETDVLSSSTEITNQSRGLRNFIKSLEDYTFSLEESIFNLEQQAKQIRASIFNAELSGFGSFFEGAGVQNSITEFFQSVTNLAGQANSIALSDQRPQIAREQEAAARDFASRQRDFQDQRNDIINQRNNERLQAQHRINQLNRDNITTSTTSDNGGFVGDSTAASNFDLLRSADAHNASLELARAQANASGTSFDIAPINTTGLSSIEDPEELLAIQTDVRNQIIANERQKQATLDSMAQEQLSRSNRYLHEHTEAFQRQQQIREDLRRAESKRIQAENDALAERIRGTFARLSNNLEIAIPQIELDRKRERGVNSSIFNQLTGARDRNAGRTGQTQAEVQIGERILALKQQQSQLKLVIDEFDSFSSSNVGKLKGVIQGSSIDDRLKEDLLDQLNDDATIEQIGKIVEHYGRQLNDTNKHLLSLEDHREAISERAGNLAARQSKSEFDQTLQGSAERLNGLYRESGRHGTIELAQIQRREGLSRIEVDYQQQLLEAEKYKTSLGGVTAEYTSLRNNIEATRRLSIENLIEQTDVLGGTLRDSLGEGLGAIFSNVREGFTSIGDLVRDVATSILETWANLLQTLAQEKLYELLIGGKDPGKEKGGNANLFGFNGVGGFVQGFDRPEQESGFNFGFTDTAFDFGGGASNEFTQDVGESFSLYKNDLEGGIGSVLSNVLGGNSVSSGGGFWGSLISTVIGSFADGGDMASIPNYKLGSPMSLYKGVSSAMKREGAGAMPVVVNDREIILSDRNGDAQAMRSLKASGEWNKIKRGYSSSMTEIGNYKYGYDSGSYNNSVSNNNSRSMVMNQTVMINTPNPQSFRHSQASISRKMNLDAQKYSQRNG